MANELGREPLPVRKHRRHGLHELPHLGGEAAGRLSDCDRTEAFSSI